MTVALAATAYGLRSHWQQRSYETLHPRKGAITESIYGLGKVRTDRRFEVKLGLTSAIYQTWVAEGDFVKQGAPLLRTDPTTFRAPFDGTVTLVAFHVGEVAPPQQVLLRLEDLKDRYIELSLEQESALRVRKGQSAKVSFESLRNEKLTGEVTTLYARDDEFVARIQVKGLGDGILPGMTADVSVEVGAIGDALLIPVRAISSGTALVVRPDGKRERVKVEIGHVDRDWAEVKSGAISLEDELLVSAGGR